VWEVEGNTIDRNALCGAIHVGCDDNDVDDERVDDWDAADNADGGQL
jgi:hypothetical protein